MTELTEPEKTTLRTYNKIAKQWANKHLGRGFWRKEMGVFHGFLPAGRLLEVGSGGGRDARELIELGYEYVGTDISDGLLAEARKNNPGVRFKKVSIYDLDFKEPFDGFWCSAVLLHIPRQRIDKALQATIKNMKPNAIGFISVKEGEGEVAEGDGRFFCYWKNNDFKEVLERNGLELLAEDRNDSHIKTCWLTFVVRVK